MPIPEPSLYRPSNLTKKQRAEQLAAVYGVSMPTQQLTEVEIQRMRAILAEHDTQQQPIQTFDLNNPPRTQYRFQKFPTMVYDHENSYPAREEERTAKSGFVETVYIPARVVTQLVHTESQLQAALADGWNEQAPGFSEAPEMVLSAGLQDEANSTQNRINEAKRGPGRPRNPKAA